MTQGRLAVLSLLVTLAVTLTLVACGGSDPEPTSVYVAEVDGSEIVRIHTLETADPVTAIAWSPDGSRLAFSTFAGVYLASADDTGLEKLTENGGLLSWSPDGSLIALRSRSEIAFMRSDATQEEYRSRGNRLTWSTDGTHSVIGGVESIVFLVRVSAGPIEAVDLGPGNFATFSPDGTRLAFLRNPSGVVVVELETLDIELHPIQSSPEVVLTSLAWSDDNASLALLRFRTDARLPGGSFPIKTPGAYPVEQPEIVVMRQGVLVNEIGVSGVLSQVGALTDDCSDGLCAVPLRRAGTAATRSSSSSAAPSISRAER